MNRLYFFIFFTAFTLIYSTAMPIQATNLVTPEQIAAEWDVVLKKVVETGSREKIKLNLVNYQQIKGDKNFSQLIQKLEKVNLLNLKNKQEKLAFWINVYNIAAIKLISEHYPVNSIKAIGHMFLKTVWKKPAIKI